MSARRNCSCPPARLHGRGFTLIEVVVVIVLTGIVAGFAALFLTAPMQSYVAQQHRATLVSGAELIERNLAEDVGAALPQSLRFANAGTAVELLSVSDWVDYWGADTSNPAPTVPPGSGVTTLGFGAPASPFSTFGAFPNTAPGSYPGVRLAIANPAVWASGAASGAMSPALTLTIAANPSPAVRYQGSAQSASDTLSWGGSFTFPQPSPTRHLFLLSGPISYLCDAVNATLTRYSGYAVSPAQPTTAAQLLAAGARAALIANGVSNCSFTELAATASSGEVLITSLTLSVGSDSLAVFDQVATAAAP